jgi:hypothetical protein
MPWRLPAPEGDILEIGSYATDDDAAAGLLAELGIAEPPSTTLEAHPPIAKLPLGYPVVARQTSSGWPTRPISGA